VLPHQQLKMRLELGEIRVTANSQYLSREIADAHSRAPRRTTIYREIYLRRPRAIRFDFL
jgi:hypothetical protein